MKEPAWSGHVEYCPRDCPKRSPTCHATCETYKRKKAEHDARVEEMHRRDAVRYGVTGQLWDAYNRRNKGRRYNNG